MSVEFKLFGELTLKQFLYVGGAGAISYLIIASNIALPLKIVLSLVIGGSGAAMALLPINNRPLEVWVGNFLLAMFNPTKRVWKKGENPNLPKTIYSMEEYDRELKAQASTLTQPQLATSGLGPITTTPIMTTALNAPAVAQLPSIPAPAPSQPTQQLINTTTALTPYQNTTQPIPATTQTQSTLRSQPNNTTMEATMSDQKTTNNLQNVITNGTPKPIGPKTRQTFVLDISKLKEHTAALPGYTPKPNVVKGVVKDATGSLLAAAIVIVKRKETNQPARAMVTNPLGEFETTSPLENGTFVIDISHMDKEMPYYEITLDATPVPPLQFQFTA